MVNSRKDPLTAYTVTFYGSQEPRELERANSTHGADAPVVNSLIDLKSFMNGDFDFESAIDHACDVTGNSGALLMSEELPPPDSTSMIPTDEPYASDADAGENRPIAESYRWHVVQFAQMAEEERTRFDRYRSTWEIARGRIAELASRLGLNSEAMSILDNQLFFDSARDTRFVLDERARESANSV
jgi:hypothetical protein